MNTISENAAGLSVTQATF